VEPVYTRTGVRIAGAACGSPHMGADIPPAGNAWTYAGVSMPTNNGAKGLNKGGYLNPNTRTKCLTRDGREVRGTPHEQRQAYHKALVAIMIHMNVCDLTRQVPYDIDGTHCLPLAKPCSSFPCQDAVVCVPRFATQAGGLRFPPKPVTVKVIDNDMLAVQKEVRTHCTHFLTSVPSKTFAGADFCC